MSFLNESVASVKNVFPDISEADIAADLGVTQNVERTIANILDGSFMKSVNAAEDDRPIPSLSRSIPQCKRSRQGSEEEVSDDVLEILGTDVLPNPIKKSKIHTTSRPVHDLSDSSEDDLPVPLFERIKLQKLQLSDKHVLNKALQNINIPTEYIQACTTDKSAANAEVPIFQNKKIESDIKKKQNKLEKSCEKERSWKELEEKRQLKEFEKAKKKTAKEALKSSKPGEAIKHMTVMIDPAILKSSGGAVILDTLQKNEVAYEIQSQPLPGIITFWREITDILEKEPLCLDTEKREVVEDEILLILPVTEFLPLVHNYKQKQTGTFIGASSLTLLDHVDKVRNSLENRKVTLVVQDMDQYFRDKNTVNQRNYREQLAMKDTKHKKKKINDAIDVSQIDVEEALIDAQLYTGCVIRFVSSDTDMGRTVLQFAKAIADTPFKRERLKTGLSLFIENSWSSKISKDGHGITNAWRQQLQQFKNVRVEVANAIMSQYKSPIDLWKAYQGCSSHSEAELLLQDIVIRRGVGVMSTSRRVGKELSRRLYQLFTSEDPDLVLK